MEIVIYWIIGIILALIGGALLPITRELFGGTIDCLFGFCAGWMFFSVLPEDSIWTIVRVFVGAVIFFAAGLIVWFVRESRTIQIIEIVLLVVGIVITIPPGII